MISPELVTTKRSISLYGAVFVFWASGFCVDASDSLKGKSDEELVHILIGGKNAWKLEAEEQRAKEVKTHFPDGFWEMSPKDAALALVRDNCNLKLKTQLEISLHEDKGRPPDKGRVELRLEYGYFSLAHEALLDLKSDRTTATLKYSVVELRGPVKRSRVEAALRRTTPCHLPPEEARRLYEIIWWLGRIQFARPEQESSTSWTTERVVATHSTRGKLSVEPGGPRKREFTLCPASLSECYDEKFDDDLYAGFVDFILRDALKRHGINFAETSTAVLGEETYTSADDKFMRTTKPPPPDTPAAGKWIDRMLQIQETNRYALWDLASLDEPLRYPDSRIDETLFRVVRQGLTPRAPNRRTGQSDFEDAARAAHALAMRKRSEAFPLVMQLLQGGDNEMRYSKEKLLDAASLLSSAKPEFAQKLTEYLRVQLDELAKSPHSTWELFDSVWRADLRALTPLLEKMATASPEDIEDEKGSGLTERPPTVAGRFHGARRILLAWREPDVLTKLKLDAIIEASSFHLGGPAEFLRQEFGVLSSDEQQQFIAFVAWLDGQRLGHSSWYTRPLKEIFETAR